MNASNPVDRTTRGASLPVPPEVIELVAQRAADIVAARPSEVESYWSAQQAADYLACPISRIRALTSANRIPFHHDGSRVLFRRSELDSWVENGGAKRP